MNAYLRWTHMVQSRVLLTGYNAETAFMSEAKKRTLSPQATTYSTNSSIIHGASRRHPRPTTQSNSKTTLSPPQSKNNTSSHWFICPYCCKVNDHFSPSCPTQLNGPKPISESTKSATFAAISSAPIPQSAKTNLIRMATSVYTKLDKKH